MVHDTIAQNPQSQNTSSAYKNSKSQNNTIVFFVQRSHGDEKRSGSEGSEEDADYVPYVPVKIRKQQIVSLCLD